MYANHASYFPFFFFFEFLSSRPTRPRPYEANPRRLHPLGHESRVPPFPRSDPPPPPPPENAYDLSISTHTPQAFNMAYAT